MGFKYIRFGFFVTLLFLIPLVSSSNHSLGGNQEILKELLLVDSGKFNPNLESHSKAFSELYKDGRIDMNNQDHSDMAKKYLSNQKEGISFGDRNILNDFVSSNLIGVNVNLSQGEGISLSEEGDKTFIVSKDGQKHDISLFNQYEKIESIESLEDGTLVIGFGSNSVSLKDTNIGQWDSLLKNLPEDFGELSLSGNGVSCGSDLCSLSFKGVDFELNRHGSFENLGNNRFSIIDGIAKFEGRNKIAGSAEFSTDISGKNIDFSRVVELRKFNAERGNGLGNSFLRIRQSEIGKTDFIDVSTGIGQGSVVACIDCNDLVKNGDYDGYVEVKRPTESVCTIDCHDRFSSEMKGLIVTKFGNDASHQGFDKNFIVSYENAGLDSQLNPKGVFTWESCEGCKVEKGEIVGVQTRNGNLLSIENNYYDSEHKVPQLRYKHHSAGASRFVPYLHYTYGNDEGITFFDGDLRRSSATEDVYNSGQFKSSNLIGTSQGSKSVKKYVEEYYKLRSGEEEYKKIDIAGPEARRLSTEILRGALQEPIYGRKFIDIDPNAFNFDSRGRKVNVANLFVTTSDGTVLLEQIDPSVLIEYENHYQFGDDTLVNLYNKQLKALSATIDYQRGIHNEFEWPSETYRIAFDAMIETYDANDARKILGDYEDIVIGSRKIEDLRSEGLSLSEISHRAERSNNQEILKALDEPLMKLTLKQESGTLTDQDFLSAVDAYTNKEKYFYDPSLAGRLLSSSLASKLSDEIDRAAFLNHIRNLEQTSSFEFETRAITGLDFELQEYLNKPDYILTDYGAIRIEDPEILRLLNEGKVSKEDLSRLYNLNKEFNDENFDKGTKRLLDAIAFKRPADLALNIVPELGPLAKSFVVMTKAKGAVQLSLAAGKLGTQGAGAFFLGFAGLTSPGTVSKVSQLDSAFTVLRSSDEITSLGRNLHRPYGEGSLYIEETATRLAKNLDYVGPNEAALIESKVAKNLVRIGSGDEEVGFMIFSKVDLNTGERIPLGTGYLHLNQENALAHKNALEEINQRVNDLSEKLNGQGIKIEFDQKARAIFSQEGTIDSTIVLRNPTHGNFGKRLNELRNTENLPEDIKKEIDGIWSSYKECCNINIKEKGVPSFITAQSSVSISPRISNQDLNSLDSLYQCYKNPSICGPVSSPRLDGVRNIDANNLNEIEVARHFERKLGFREGSLNVENPQAVGGSGDVIILSHTTDDGIKKDALAIKIFSEEGLDSCGGPCKEIGALNELRNNGINTPHVVSLEDIQGGTMIATEIAPGTNARNLIQEFSHLRGESRVNRLDSLRSQIGSIGDELGKVHQKGLEHGDFNIGNVHVSKGGLVTVFDVETLRPLNNPSRDVVKFVKALEDQGQRAGLKPEEIQSVREAFINSYISRSGISRESLTL